MLLFTLAVVVAVSSALIVHKARASGRVEEANLGRMSGEWLAEHGASTRY